jgi:predicted Zn-ribbon and HTH transcriptional regulator
MTSRPCAKCGYDLKGLEIGSVCPECGTTIKPKSAFGPRGGTMTDADPRYVKRIIAGFSLMSAAILASMFGLVATLFGGWLGYAMLLAGGAAWVGGIWLISGRRPPDFHALGNPILDAERSRLTVRVASGGWALFVVLIVVGAAFNAGGMAGATGVIAIAASIAGLAAFAGLVPISIFVAELEFWMSDDTGGWQLRGAAWAMLIFGVLALVSGFVTPFLAVWCSVVVLVAAGILFWHIIGCSTQARWVLRYQRDNEGRAERITERLRDRTERGGTVAGSTPCLACGYELRGLPYGGRCPECGESYADRTPIPIRATPERRPEDDEPLSLSEDAQAGVIRPNPTSITGRRKPAPADESPIPLSGDEPFSTVQRPAKAAPAPDPRPSSETPPPDLDPDEPDDFQDPPTEPTAPNHAADDGPIPFADDDEPPRPARP